MLTDSLHRSFPVRQPRGGTRHSYACAALEYSKISRMFEISGAGCNGNETQDLPVELSLLPRQGALLGGSEDVLEAHGTRGGLLSVPAGCSERNSQIRELNSGVLPPAYGLPLVREAATIACKHSQMSYAWVAALGPSGGVEEGGRSHDVALLKFQGAVV